MASECDPEEVLRDVLADRLAGSGLPETAAHVDMRLPDRISVATGPFRDLLASLHAWGSAVGSGGRVAIGVWRDTDSATAENGSVGLLAEATRLPSPPGSGENGGGAAVPAAVASAVVALGGRVVGPAAGPDGIERLGAAFAARSLPGAAAIATHWGAAFRHRRMLLARRNLLDPARFEASVAALGMEVVTEHAADAAIAALTAANRDGRRFDYAVVCRSTLGADTPRLLAALRALPEGQRPGTVLVDASANAEEPGPGADVVLHARQRWRRVLETLFDLSRQSAAARSGGDAAIPSFRGKRVLLAEDVATNRALIRAMLAPTGAICIEAGNGREAIEAAREAAPDVVLMDIQMPVMDGLEATRQLRLAGLPVPVIALTAHARDEDRERYLALGMDGYLAKPIRVDDLYAALGAAFARGGEDTAA